MRAINRAFSLVEILVVVVIMGILAAMVVPQFTGATDNARTTSIESSLATVRSSIAVFRTRALVMGGDPYPTLAQLNSKGTVLLDGVPTNPFSGANGVQSVTHAQAQSRAVFNESSAGWCYYVNNNAIPPEAVFYANSTQETTRENGSGTVPANKL